MAISLIGTNGLVASGNEKVSDTSLVVTFTAVSVVGDRLYLGIALDNLTASTPTVLTAVDSRLNVWTSYTTSNAGSGTAAADVILHVWKCDVTIAHQINDTVTLALSGAVTAKAGAVIGYRGVDLTVAESGLVSGRNTSGAVSLGGTVAADRAAIAFHAREDNALSSDDTDTTSGTWSTGTGAFTTGGTAATNVAITSQTKITTSQATQNYDSTASGGWSAVFFVLTPIPVQPMGSRVEHIPFMGRTQRIGLGSGRF